MAEEHTEQVEAGTGRGAEMETPSDPEVWRDKKGRWLPGNPYSAEYGKLGGRPDSAQGLESDPSRKLAARIDELAPLVLDDIKRILKDKEASATERRAARRDAVNLIRAKLARDAEGDSLSDYEREKVIAWLEGLPTEMLAPIATGDVKAEGLTH